MAIKRKPHYPRDFPKYKYYHQLTFLSLEMTFLQEGSSFSLKFLHKVNIEGTVSDINII